MTIREVRIYYFSKDAEMALHLNQHHWGFAAWFDRRLKPIRQQLRGPEAKGVNIVNLLLCDDPIYAFNCLNKWEKSGNTFTYGHQYDLASLLHRSPIENIQPLMLLYADLASHAPWPQVIAIGRIMREPLSEVDRESLLPYLQPGWQRRA